MKRMIMGSTNTMMSEQEVREFMESQLRIFIRTDKDQFLLNAGILQRVLRMNDKEFQDIYNKIEDEVNTRTTT